jgi:hypothetical protein
MIMLTSCPQKCKEKKRRMILIHFGTDKFKDMFWCS